MAGYKTDRKHVPHSRGLRKADLMVKDIQLAGIRDLIIDESLRHEFHGSCVNPMRIGEASHAEANDALDAVVKAKLDNYQHDYNERNFCESVLVLVVRGQQFRYDRISRVEPCMADSQGVSAAGVVL